MKIIQLHQTIAKHDAIGNDIEKIAEISSVNNDSYVYAENMFNDKLTYISEEQLSIYIQKEENLVIYHHSVFWDKGEKILDNCKCKIIIRYHNITPEKFFEEYSVHYFEQCKSGRAQTIKLAKNYDAFWMCASIYNSLDILEYVDKDKICIIPPFNKIEEWCNEIPDEKLLSDLMNSREINLLFVGRIAPNKNHIFLFEVLRSYIGNYSENIVMRIIGKTDKETEKYNNELEEYIEKFALCENIEFIGEVNDQTLLSYYLGSDFYLCASEHEGFCVPLLESQYFMLPVIAKGTSAIPETIGKNQIVLDNDIKAYASAINLLYKEQSYRNFIRISGKENYNSRFKNELIEEKFIDFLREKLGINV
jgi:glycosyltransferase involved in cell wall biosynthesis